MGWDGTVGVVEVEVICIYTQILFLYTSPGECVFKMSNI